MDKRIATCINKIRDKNNHIVSYEIMYNDTNEVISIKSDDLKSAIQNNEIIIDNLKLTSDKRIITNNTSTGINIESRNTRYIGKPRLIAVSSFAKLSGTQQKILDKLQNEKYAVFDKQKDNISIDMKDLSAITAYTGIEYSLFRRNDKYIVFKGTNSGIYIDEKNTSKLIVNKYKWVGHTHPGNNFNCLIPSDADYEVLKKFNQRQSMIYNSVGDYYIFGEEDE